ncbi:MAG: N-acetylmuramoyl-L-alanine amidase [Candidatus Omnitrophota bacterium]|jgi:N-acetylmuramoyl-L-alanine amidase
MIKKNTIFLLFLIFLISGCATLPVKENIPSCSLNGTTYYSLAALCELKGISFRYDTFSRTVNLLKDNHSIDLMVSDNLILVDKRAVLLDYPVDIYQGSIVVPAKFKGQILDTLFKPAKTIVSRRVSPFSSSIRKVVIDAGHGGHDPGAIGRTGLREKDVNLDIAKRLADRLRADGISVVMTRNSDKFIPLGTRVNIANNSKADLFISIHSNASRTRSLYGFEVYYVSPSVSDSSRAFYSAKNAYLNLDSACFASQSQNLKAILWDMLYTYNRAESIYLSRAICRSAVDNLNVKVLGVKDARFEVLRGARMPAILIEAGFLSNPKEERLLRDGYYREKLSLSIREGLCNYAGKAGMTEVSRR